MNTKQAIEIAGAHLNSLSGHVFDIVTVAKPISQEAALNLSKVISKLSPLLGNLIEFNAVEFLNNKSEFKGWGKWRRQDPGFPDAIFDGRVTPAPGFEIKTWFPLATEITARFKDSQNHFCDDRTYVAMLAWLPEQLIYGRPYILDVCVASGHSVAKARDDHYHNPPDYIILEPEDTASRTRNLQQTNTNGYKFQGTPEQLRKAQRLVATWGRNGSKYKPTREYQQQLRTLINRFSYRLDTNFAKMDRIVHSGIEEFKTRVFETPVNGMTVRQWNRLFASGNDAQIKTAFQSHLNIQEVDAGELLR
jgi:hypothetical protein